MKYQCRTEGEVSSFNQPEKDEETLTSILYRLYINNYRYSILVESTTVCQVVLRRATMNYTYILTIKLLLQLYSSVY